jgi:hypothetical protein
VEQCVSEDLYQPYRNRQAWLPGDIQDSDWIYHLNAAEVAELETAMHAVEQQGIALIDIDRRNFQIPQLLRNLQPVQNNVLHGIGFALLRGLDFTRYTKTQCAILYMGLRVCSRYLRCSRINAIDTKAAYTTSSLS